MLICVADVLAVLDIRQLVEMETQDELIKPEGARFDYRILSNNPEDETQHCFQDAGFLVPKKHSSNRIAACLLLLASLLTLSLALCQDGHDKIFRT